MDFLRFKTNHGMEYAINIADIIAIIKPGPITTVPGSPKGVIGMISYQGELIAVIDTAELYEGVHKPSNLLMIVQSKQNYGILIDSVSDIIRGDIPEDVRFIDPYDYERSVLGFDKEAVRIELF